MARRGLAKAGLPLRNGRFVSCIRLFACAPPGCSSLERLTFRPGVCIWLPWTENTRDGLDLCRDELMDGAVDQIVANNAAREKQGENRYAAGRASNGAKHDHVVAAPQRVGERQTMPLVIVDPAVNVVVLFRASNCTADVQVLVLL